MAKVRPVSVEPHVFCSLFEHTVSTEFTILQLIKEYDILKLNMPNLLRTPFKKCLIFRLVVLGETV